MTKFFALRPLFAVSCLALLSLRPALAQLGSADLPDLSGLAGAIESAQAAPAPPPPGTLFRTGLAVPPVHPGETARGIGRRFREGVERQKGPSAAMQKLEDAMPGLLASFETHMTRQGFARRDLGVALGVFFTVNWKNAAGQTLSDSAEAAAVRSVAALAAGKYKAKFAAMPPAQREKTYESLLTTSLLLNALAQSFDKAGKAQEASSMRGAAGRLFEKVIGLPPAQVTIAADGRITAEASQAASVPAAPGGAGVKPSQIAGVYAVQVVRIGVGGSFSQPFVPVLALKDGTYTEDFEVPPADLDIAESRRRHPGDWGRWRFNAASSIGQWNGSARHVQTQSKKGVWEATDWIGPLAGGKPGQHLSGSYKASGGGGSAAGGFAYGFEQVYTFFPDGRYQFGQSAGFSSGSEVNGSVAGSTHTKRPLRGTYEIGSYGITLRGGDGTVKRWSYARMADGLLFLQGYAYTDSK